MARSGKLVWAGLVVVGWLVCGCPQKKVTPPPPPQELIDELAAAVAKYNEVAPLSPPAEEALAFAQLIAAAQAALQKADYPTALDKARRARLEAEKIHARLVYRDLEKLNPPPEVTYYYRQQMQAAEQAEAAGNIPQAIAAAQEARRQAGLGLEYMGQCIEKAKQNLAAIKTVLEVMYHPDYDLIKMFWDLNELLASGDCQKITAGVGDLQAKMEKAKSSTRITGGRFRVSAPPDFVEQYGQPRMYAEVTPDGRLQTVIGKVEVGNEVIFIRCLFYSREKTYYFVLDPVTGTKGWMGERYVWPERADRSQGSGGK